MVKLMCFKKEIQYLIFLFSYAFVLEQYKTFFSQTEVYTYIVMSTAQTEKQNRSHWRKVSSEVGKMRGRRGKKLILSFKFYGE